MEQPHESTPILSKVSDMNEKKRQAVREARERAAAEIKKSEERLQFFMYCGSCIVISLFVGSIVWFFHYIISTLDEREVVDQHLTTVSEKWIDRTTNEQVNCTNENPCSDWTCLYVKEHFHKTPDECVYQDHLKAVVITVSVVLSIALCKCIFG